MSDAARLSAPSVARNREPILQALRRHLPATGLVLEVASGTGEHVAYLAEALPLLHWQPTDPDADRRASIEAWAGDLPNVRHALDLEAISPIWPVARADVVLCINMIHIAPWAAAEGLVAGAARVLPARGLLALYGPFRVAGEAMGPGNAAFDAELRATDPAWGLRSVEAVAALAAAAGFGPVQAVAMPADNQMLLFRRQA